MHPNKIFFPSSSKPAAAPPASPPAAPVKKKRGPRKINNKDYVCWVVQAGKIVSGWEYAEDAADHKKEIAEETGAANAAKVYKRAGLKRLGMDPDVNSDWQQGTAK